MFTADLLERAAKSGAQGFVVAFIGSLTASLTPGVSWSLAWWQTVGLAAVTAGAMGLMSGLTSVVSKPFGSTSSASILPASVVPEVTRNVPLAATGDTGASAHTLAEPLPTDQHAGA